MTVSFHSGALRNSWTMAHLGSSFRIFHNNWWLSVFLHEKSSLPGLISDHSTSPTIRFSDFLVEVMKGFRVNGSNRGCMLAQLQTWEIFKDGQLYLHCVLGLPSRLDVCRAASLGTSQRRSFWFPRFPLLQDLVCWTFHEEHWRWVPTWREALPDHPPNHHSTDIYWCEDHHLLGLLWNQDGRHWARRILLVLTAM